MSTDLYVSSEMLKLEERRADFLGISVIYYFFELLSPSGQRYYAVEVVSDDDTSLAVVGKESALAYEFYERIVNSGVTPCSLQDVVSDKFMEMKYL